MGLGAKTVLEGSRQVVGKKSRKTWAECQEKRRKKLAQYHEKRRKKWSEKEEETLKKMWVAGYARKEIARKVGHNMSATYARARKLGLPMRVVKRHKMDLEPIDMMPTKGIVKCHNCLEEIVLSKKGLERDYKGGKMGKKTIFWHMPGKCPGDPSAHFNQLEAKRRRGRGRPSEYERWHD